MGFPTRPSELTPAWLSEVLSADVADFRTETIGVGSGFAGSIYRVHLTQDSSSEAGDLPETLIWKTISTHPSTHELLTQLGIYQSEADFYARLAGHARVAPRAHYYDYDVDSGSVCLLLEDLTGMEAGDQIEGFTPKQARMIVSTLAGLHAKFWEGRRDDSPLGVRKFDYEASISRRMHSASWSRVRESALTVPQGLLDTAEFIQPFLGTIRNRIGASPTTLLHGDVRADNAFFDADTVKLIDWQAVREGRAAYDLAYFVSTSLTEETGRQHQEDLLDLYVETIASLGVEGYGMSECLEDFRWALLDVVSFVGIIGAALDFSEGRGLQLANLVMSRLWSSLEENRAIDLLDRASPST